MKKVVILFSAFLFLSIVPRNSSALSYYGFSEFGGKWVDAEKLPDNLEDDEMCWAAAASNILNWTGWGDIFSDSEDAIFGYYQNHWTDLGGFMEYAWNWWFDGTNPSEGWAGYSQVDEPGGGFYTDLSFSDYYHGESYYGNTNGKNALNAIKNYLNSGYGVTLAIYGPGAHAITCWGYDYDEQDNVLGLWITDSDDDKHLLSPPDQLAYYDVFQTDPQSKWFLADYAGSDGWYIDYVQALDRTPIPEPVSILLFGSGCAVLGGMYRRKRGVLSVSQNT